MASLRIKNYPDTSKCAHKGFGLTGHGKMPVIEEGRMLFFEAGYCSDCKFPIGYRLDQSGARTGETRIIEFEEVNAAENSV